MEHDQLNEKIDLIKEKMIDGLLKYLETGEFSGNSASAFMDAYTAVNSLSDNSNDKNNNNEVLFNFYIKVITNHVKSEADKMKIKSDEELVDAFLEKNDKFHINQCKKNQKANDS